MNKDNLTWKDVLAFRPSWGDTYKGDIREYRKLVKREGYKYFIWNDRVIRLIDHGIYLSHEDTHISQEEL